MRGWPTLLFVYGPSRSLFCIPPFFMHCRFTGVVLAPPVWLDTDRLEGASHIHPLTGRSGREEAVDNGMESI